MSRFGLPGMVWPTLPGPARQHASIYESIERPAMTPDLHHPIHWLRWISSNIKRLIVLVVGVALLGAGLAMLVLPGPGFLVVVAGLAVLATEFAWAERALDRTRSTATVATTKLTASRTGRATFALSAIALIVGGAAVVAALDDHRLLGVTTLVSGLCALAVLLPAAQRWINRPNTRTSTAAATPVPATVASGVAPAPLSTPTPPKDH